MSKLLSYLRFSAALFCLVVLAACQTMGGTGLIQSEVTAELSTEAASSIAADMVERLAEHIGPGSTTIALRGNDIGVWAGARGVLAGQGLCRRD